MYSEVLLGAYLLFGRNEQVVLACDVPTSSAELNELFLCGLQFILPDVVFMKDDGVAGTRWRVTQELMGQSDRPQTPASSRGKP